MKLSPARCLIILASASSLFAACAPADDFTEPVTTGMPPDPELATVSLALTTVPAGVSCVRLTSQAGMKKVQSKASVTPDASALVTFAGLPPGPCSLLVEAFSQSCGNVSETTLPTWVSDAVMASLQAGEDANINFVLKPAAGVKGSLDFISLTLTPGGVSFAPTLVGSATPPVAFTVKNIGSSTTGALTVAMNGPTPADFGIVANTCTTLAADATCTVQVRFAPLSPGAKAAQLSVSGSPGGTVIAALTGVGQTPAQLTISPTTQFFMVGIFGGSDERFLIVGNAGSQGTGSVGIQITGPDADKFSLPAGGCAPLAGGATCSLKVRFTKPIASSGTSHATLTVTAAPGGAATAQLIGD